MLFSCASKGVFGVDEILDHGNGDADPRRDGGVDTGNALPTLKTLFFTPAPKALDNQAFVFYGDGAPVD